MSDWSAFPEASAAPPGRDPRLPAPLLTVRPEGAKESPAPPATEAADPWSAFPAAPFKDRFSGEGLAVPKNAAALTPALRREADKKLAKDDPGGEAETAIENFANTAMLNIPRNVEAFVKSHQTGRPFAEEYQALKDKEEAGNRLNPKSAIAGTVAGIGAGALTLPGIGGGATLGARAVRAGLTGGGYAGLAEAFDSKDPVHVAVASALGLALGTVAAPVAEKIVGLVSGLVKKGKTADVFLKPDGTLTDEAIAAAKAAGIDPALFNDVLSRKFAETFAKKGATPATAREAAADEFGVKLSPGQAADNYGVIATEQSMARDAQGPVAGGKARQFFEGQEEQVGRAKTGIQERVAEQQPLVGSVNEASNTAGAGARQRAGEAKAEFQGAYRDALSREGEFADVTFHNIGERIRRDSLKDKVPVIISDRTTPIASEAIQHLDANIGKLHIQRAEDSRIVGVNLEGVDQARKELVTFYKAAKSSGNDTDIRAMRRLIKGFDDELETAMATGLFKGDESALPALKRARELFSNYQKTFRSEGPGDAVGRSMQKIVERDATGGDIANLLYGKAAIGEKGDAVKLAGRLKQVLGPQSEEWSAVRQGLWLRLTSKPEGMTDFGPQALSERIFKFTNGDGADMARAMFSAKEIGEMRRFATVLKTTVPPTGTVNFSNTAYTLMRDLGIGSALGGGSLFLTNDPVLSGALAGVKVGAKLAGWGVKGFRAGQHFSSGAPSQAAIAAGRSRGPAAGITGAKLDDQIIGDQPSGGRAR